MKMFVVVGINYLLGTSGPLGVARTPEGRDKIVEESAYICDDIKAFELEVEEDRETEIEAQP